MNHSFMCRHDLENSFIFNYEKLRAYKSIKNPQIHQVALNLHHTRETIISHDSFPICLRLCFNIDILNEV